MYAIQSKAQQPRLQAGDLPVLFWCFTESNFPTFVLPNTMFGVLAGLAGDVLTTRTSPPSLQVMLLVRLPFILFNWVTVFIFDLANQRLPESVQEDKINKPWRPIPTGRITGDQTRQLLLAAIPLTLALNCWLGVGQESCLILLITWLYNDLRGGDGLMRDGFIAIAYGLFNRASLCIALGGYALAPQGYMWIALISGVIWTTMQIQDLKDQQGDRSRGRLSMPLWLGDTVSRWLISLFTLAWSLVCVEFWELPLWGLFAPLGMAVCVGLQLVLQQSAAADALAWRLWCLWLVTLYLLPLCASWSGQSSRWMNVGCD
ncbi:hypothetical protein BP00DRAFT_343057 [Aspergillus indologenus CBS 114.80]|uniref:UbiA prenyltransferase n=1 Tax=Aspergillus indologenus CBS 114.80 TaxID=1450541 RepID=A0A2V5IT68_9EURO|nr:hypothetical protein BP00DRAFT_343057 [Aspergillus indologenus CBS 114.80]